MSMKFVTIRDLRSRSRQIQEELPRYRELVLTSNGKPIAIMTAVSEASLEDSLAAIRRARAVSAVTDMQMKSVRLRRYMLRPREIESEIRKVRARKAAR